MGILSYLSIQLYDSVKYNPIIKYFLRVFILGAFLLPYFFFMVFLGIPMLYLEMCLGQYTSQGPSRVWLIAPLFGGKCILMEI